MPIQTPDSLLESVRVARQFGMDEDLRELEVQPLFGGLVADKDIARTLLAELPKRLLALIERQVGRVRDDLVVVKEFHESASELRCGRGESGEHDDLASAREGPYEIQDVLDARLFALHQFG